MFLYYLLMLFCYFLGGALGRLCRLFYCFYLNSTAFFDLLSISRSSREKIRENTKQSKSTRKQSNLIHKDLPRKSGTEHETYQGYTQKVLGGTRGGGCWGRGTPRWADGTEPFTDHWLCGTHDCTPHTSSHCLALSPVPTFSSSTFSSSTVSSFYFL